MTRRKPNSKLRARNSELVSKLLVWFSVNARDLPWRRTRDPYAIWVSEIMLQQTQVKTVIAYWERWMRALPTIESAAQASPAKLHKLWEGLGYYTRVRNLQRAAKQIVAFHDGKFPENFDDILALPGIGRYTAGAIASIAFNLPRPILDGNVIRVLTRIFGITTDPRETKTNARLWQLATELVSDASRGTHHGAQKNLRTRTRAEDEDDQPCSHLNQSLMELGALICTPRSPKCAYCPVNKLCVARKRNLQDKLPRLHKRPTAKARCFVAFIVERRGRFLVRQRPTGVVNAHLWEFPNVEVGARPSGPQRGGRHKSLTSFRVPPRMEVLRLEQPRAGFGDFVLASTKPLCTIKHSITRYRITLEAYRARLASARAIPKGQWRTRSQLHNLAFASAHKKILGVVAADVSPRNCRPFKVSAD